MHIHIHTQHDSCLRTGHEKSNSNLSMGCPWVLGHRNCPENTHPHFHQRPGCRGGQGCETHPHTPHPFRKMAFQAEVWREVINPTPEAQAYSRSPVWLHKEPPLCRDRLQHSARILQGPQHALPHRCLGRSPTVVQRWQGVGCS